jgi:hypothetical protein
MSSCDEEHIRTKLCKLKKKESMFFFEKNTMCMAVTGSPLFGALWQGFWVVDSFSAQL